MGGWPVGYLHNAVQELNSGLPSTNPDSNRVEDLNQGPPDFKSSALNHSTMLPPEMLDPELSSLTMRPPRLPQYQKIILFLWSFSLTGWGFSLQQTVHIYYDTKRVHEPTLVPLPHLQDEWWGRGVYSLCQGLPQRPWHLICQVWFILLWLWS